MKKTSYIRTLSEADRISIENELKVIGIDKEKIELAMNSRLCDLEDTIDIGLGGFSMTWLELINETKNADLVRSYLQGKISRLELADGIGNSNTDLVIQYQTQQKNKLN